MARSQLMKMATRKKSQTPLRECEEAEGGTRGEAGTWKCKAADESKNHQTGQQKDRTEEFFFFFFSS